MVGLGHGGSPLYMSLVDDIWYGHWIRDKVIYICTLPRELEVSGVVSSYEEKYPLCIDGSMNDKEGKFYIHDGGLWYGDSLVSNVKIDMYKDLESVPKDLQQLVEVQWFTYNLGSYNKVMDS